MTRRRGERGMSHLELLVALAIVSIVLLAGGSLLVHMNRQVQRQALRAPATGGASDFALERLERDLREAVDLRVVGGGPEGQQLFIDEPDGAKIRWRLDGTTLFRRVQQGHGQPLEKRVATEVALVDWRRRSIHLVDVVLRVRDEPIRQRTVLLRNLDRLRVESE